MSVPQSPQSAESKDLPHGMSRGATKRSDISEVSTHVSIQKILSLDGQQVKDHDMVAYVNPLFFQRFINATIFLNVVMAGLCAERGASLRITCSVMEVLFTIVFSMEVMLKLSAQSKQYFNSYWNMLDFALVIWGIGSLFIVPLLSDSECETCQSFSVARLLRLSKTLRLLRVLRSNRPLRILVEGLVSSLKAMCWVALLLGMIIYAGAFFASSAFNAEEGGFTWDEGYFDTLPDSMLTLFDMAIGQQWGNVVRPLAKDGHTDAVLWFILYVFLSSFAILNLIIGIIVEATAKAASEHEQREELSRQTDKMQHFKVAVENLFSSVNRDDDALLTAEELERADPDALRAIFDGLTFPPDFSLRDLHLLVSPEVGISERELVKAIHRIIFSNQFERDCLFQCAMNDIRRRFKRVEETQNVMKTLMQKVYDEVVRPERVQPTATSLHASVAKTSDVIVTHDGGKRGSNLDVKFHNKELYAKIDQLVTDVQVMGNAVKVEHNIATLHDQTTVLDNTMTSFQDLCAPEASSNFNLAPQGQPADGQDGSVRWEHGRRSEERDTRANTDTWSASALGGGTTITQDRRPKSVMTV